MPVRDMAVREEFGKPLGTAQATRVEPPWKMLLSNIRETFSWDAPTCHDELEPVRPSPVRLKFRAGVWRRALGSWLRRVVALARLDF
jgi:hypothetical protein